MEIPDEQSPQLPIHDAISPGSRPPTNIRHSRPPKRRGEEGELAFMRRAIAEGSAIAKPWGDSERYDFILDNRVRLWRVQVRSTGYEVHHGFAVHAYVMVKPQNGTAYFKGRGPDRRLSGSKRSLVHRAHRGMHLQESLVFSRKIHQRKSKSFARPGIISARRLPPMSQHHLPTKFEAPRFR